MNKIKIPKNWVFKYFEVEGNTTKFVYEDQLGIEHIYIDEKPEPELPTYEELQDKCNKQKEVLDKIKEKVNQYELIKGYYDYIEENGYAETTSHDTLKEDILELLEEIE